jgi:dipeptidyl aminopeptidase/acylaminoacyl peptidase
VKALVRPDGAVWYVHMRGDREPRALCETGEEVVRAEGERPPASRPYESWHFENQRGQRVHGFHVVPEGRGPFPIIMLVHGGPTFLDSDRWQPEVQAYVDAGFAVGMVNYRGSVGYGREWRDVLIAERVTAPVLFIAGENDSRCPIRQVMLYVERLRARGHQPELYLFSTGHSSFDVDERVRQVGTILEFLRRRVPAA